MGSRGVDTAAGDVVPEQHQQAASELLESIGDEATGANSVGVRSTEYGPNGGELGFTYRRSTLTVEFQTGTNAAGSTPNIETAESGLVELDDNTPLGAAGERYALLEQQIIETVAEAVIGFPRGEELDPVTMWPVANDAGLYRVGYVPKHRDFLYAASFKIPASELG